MKKTIVYFMRHAEVYNPSRVLYGRLPRFGITDAGREIIESRVPEFQKKHISLIYASPLLRTRQTSAILSKGLGLPVRYSKRLIEVGTIYAGVGLHAYYDDIQYRMYGEESVKDGHESVEMVRERMLRFLQSLLGKHEGEEILVVSHADPILILKTSLLGISFTHQWKKVNYLHTGSYETLICQGDDRRWI